MIKVGGWGVQKGGGMVGWGDGKGGGCDVWGHYVTFFQFGHYFNACSKYVSKTLLVIFFDIFFSARGYWKISKNEQKQPFFGLLWPKKWTKNQNHKKSQVTFLKTIQGWHRAVSLHLLISGGNFHNPSLNW